MMEDRTAAGANGLRPGRALALLALTGLLLSACATGSSVNKAAPTITIDDVMLGTAPEAYDAAHAHCEAYDSRAQMLKDRKSDGTITFACVN